MEHPLRGVPERSLLQTLDSGFSGTKRKPHLILFIDTAKLICIMYLYIHVYQVLMKHLGLKMKYALRGFPSNGSLSGLVNTE